MRNSDFVVVLFVSNKHIPMYLKLCMQPSLCGNSIWQKECYLSSYQLDLFLCSLYNLWLISLSVDVTPLVPLNLQAQRIVKINNINCMQSIWLMSTNIQFLSFFLFHAPSFILLLYCAFEIKTHVNEIHSISYAPYAIYEMLPPLWFSLVLVQLYADWLSHSPADPALILPPISFNKLTQAQTWDSSSYSVPSEGDCDNGRWLCTSSSIFSLISQQ